MRQLVHPFSLSFFQSLLQSIDNDFIHSLGLAIAMRVCWGGVSVLYAQITTISPKGLSIELKPVIRYESVWDPKFCNDVSPHKSLYILISDVGKRLGLYLFGEASNHAMRKYLRFPMALGNGPTISNPHYTMGHGLVRGLSLLPG